jgi:plasmid stability protein
MTHIIISNIDPQIMAGLRARARRHGRSVAEEARDLLQSVVRRQGITAEPLGTRLKSRFAHIGLDHDIAELRG